MVLTTGPDTGATVMSDANGNYLFTSVAAGVVSIKATMAGYLPSSPEGVNISADTQTDVFMAPVPPRMPAATPRPLAV